MAWARITEPVDKGAHELIRDRGPIAALEAVRDGSVAAAERLRPRLELVDPDRERHILEVLDARVVVPGDEEWPAGLDDLSHPPHCLWVRGPVDLADACRRSAAIVGARAATNYGEGVAADLAAGLAERGFAVVSGAAYGVDAAAHRGALAVDGTTVAVLAGGVDRPYPAAHARLLRTIAETGLVVSEVPPGSAPTRYRFLKRNRLIAALTRGTVVVEAGLRSGSRSTATAATEIGRVVAAVPGPVTSMVSAGCHELIRSGEAVLVTDAAEAAEAVGDLGADLAPAKSGPVRPEDGLTGDELKVWSALPVRSPVSAERLAVRAALTARTTAAVLGRLALEGLAVQDRDGWRKSPPEPEKKGSAAPDATGGEGSAEPNGREVGAGA
jgi:DNA processing protein